MAGECGEHSLGSAFRSGGDLLLTLIILAGVLVRAAILVAHRGVWIDLRIYQYFGELARNGMNPYLAPVGGPIHPSYADMPPASMLVFAGVLLIHNSAWALRVFFVLVDVAILVLLPRLAGGERAHSRALTAFYALNPFVIASLVMATQDKAILILLLVLCFLALERNRSILATMAAAGLAAYKWMGIVLLVPLTTYFARRDRRCLWLLPAIFSGMVIVSFLPWFPSNLVAWHYRQGRASTTPPLHASPTQLLAAVGLYHPLFVPVFGVVLLVAIELLLVRRRLSVREAAVLSIFFPYMAAPDVSFHRIVLVTFPLLLILRPSRARWLALWAATILSTAALALELRGLPGPLAGVGWLRAATATTFAREGSLQHVVFMNLFPALAFCFWLADRAIGRVARQEGKVTTLTIE